MDEYHIRVYTSQGFTRELQGTRLILTRLQLPEFKLESFVYFLISNERWLRNVTIRAICRYIFIKLLCQ